MTRLLKQYSRDNWWKKLIRYIGYSVAIIFILNIIILPTEDFSDQILIIPITGTIYSGSNGAFSQDTYSDDIIAQLETAQETPGIKAVILAIDSPGGTVVGSKEISQAIESFDKPIISWMRETAASGAYWIAVSTEHIIADPATITGSIGVAGSYLQFSELLDEYGVKYERIVSGEFKDVGSPFKNVTDEDRVYLQSKINILNDMFIEHVADKRGLTESFVRQQATGEIFLGTEALQRRLIDSLGGRQEAIVLVAEMAGTEDYTVITYERESSFFDRIIYGLTATNPFDASTEFSIRADLN